MRLAAFVLVLVGIARAAPLQHFDPSFKALCEFMKGNYRPRDPHYLATTGDKCDFVFKKGTTSHQEALNFCEEKIPFHINKVEHGNTVTKCFAEATLICGLQGFVQMFGRCYYMEKRMQSYNEAKDTCKGLKSEIAYLHREALVNRWKSYFKNVRRIWVRASEAFTKNLQYNKGPNLILAFSPLQFGGNRPDALVGVQLNQKAMVLCEYKPHMTLAESNYLLRRYGEIYYPPVFTSNGASIRSTSGVLGISSDKAAYSKYCKNVLKPFFDEVRASKSTVPTEEFLEVITEKRSGTLIRTCVHSNDAIETNRDSILCAKSIVAKNYGSDYHGLDGQRFFFKRIESDIWRPDEPKELCDGGSWSTAIVLSRSSPGGLETMSDARYGPIYCEPRFDALQFASCPKGYTQYERANGQVWCHKFITEQSYGNNERKAGYDYAQEYCQKNENGSFLSGFTNQEELRLMDGLLRAAQKKGTVFDEDGRVWLGAKRRKECRKSTNPDATGFDADKNSPCSRVRVFEWANGVATNPPDFLPNWMSASEPNSLGTDGEDCVELMRGMVKNWGGLKNGTLKINDIPCRLGHYAFCGKEAAVETVQL